MQWKWAVAGIGPSHVRAALWDFAKSAAVPYGEVVASRDEESGAVGIGAAGGVGTPSFSRRSVSSYAAPAEGPIS